MTRLKAGPFTLRGVSVGGVYTSIYVQELGAVLDVGMALRSFAGADLIFISHGHADHIGSLPALLGIRGLLHKQPPRVYVPKETLPDIEAALAPLTRAQRYDLAMDAVGVAAGDEHSLHSDLWVRSFSTFHPVPSVGYQFFRRVRKLKDEFKRLSGEEIRDLRQHAAGEMFFLQDNLELAYATDTLVEVLDKNPELYRSRVLVLECSFLDDRKSLRDTRAGCHIHLDELLERASLFQNEHVVLMHFSQLYSPAEVHAILEQRCPPDLHQRLRVFAPQRGAWPG